MKKIDINDYDGFIDNNKDLVKTILVAIVSILATLLAYNFSEILFGLILLPCILLWFMLLREWLTLISIKSPLKWRKLIHILGFFLIPFLATYFNGGPALSLRWAKIEIYTILQNPLNWENESMFTYSFIAWLCLTSLFIVYLTYLSCSPKFNSDGRFPAYPLRISFYLSFAAFVSTFFSTPVYINFTVAPAFLISVVFYNFCFLISYLFSSNIFSRNSVLLNNKT